MRTSAESTLDGARTRCDGCCPPTCTRSVCGGGVTQSAAASAVPLPLLLLLPSRYVEALVGAPRSTANARGVSVNESGTSAPGSTRTLRNATSCSPGVGATAAAGSQPAQSNGWSRGHVHSTNTNTVSAAATATAVFFNVARTVRFAHAPPPAAVLTSRPAYSKLA